MLQASFKIYRPGTLTMHSPNSHFIHILIVYKADESYSRHTKVRYITPSHSKKDGESERMREYELVTFAIKFFF